MTTHAGVGAFLGSMLPSCRSAALAGVASHFALDALPHWGAGPDGLAVRARVARVDGTAALVVLGALAWSAYRCPSPRRARSFVGALAATVPDWDKPVWEFFRRELWPAPVNAFHRGIQNESPDRLGRELAIAACSAAAVVATIAGSARRS